MMGWCVVCRTRNDGEPSNHHCGGGGPQQTNEIIANQFNFLRCGPIFVGCTNSNSTRARQQPGQRQFGSRKKAYAYRNFNLDWLFYDSCRSKFWLMCNRTVHQVWPTATPLPTGENGACRTKCILPYRHLIDARAVGHPS